MLSVPLKCRKLVMSFDFLLEQPFEFYINLSLVIYPVPRPTPRLKNMPWTFEFAN
jgi:hypothetical protein